MAVRGWLTCGLLAIDRLAGQSAQVMAYLAISLWVIRDVAAAPLISPRCP